MGYRTAARSAAGSALGSSLEYFNKPAEWARVERVRYEQYVPCPECELDPQRTLRSNLNERGLSGIHAALAARAGPQPGPTCVAASGAPAKLWA
jgi:hypothetical protein